MDYSDYSSSSDAEYLDINYDHAFIDFSRLSIGGTGDSNVAVNEFLGGANAEQLNRQSVYWRKNEKGITKESRATVQQVLDRRTLYRLSKLAFRGAFSRLFGVISAGKEANVYEAINSDGCRLVVKVYKTSILAFKDRSKYMQGEFRFRRGYMGSKNPRKMVKQWAEKEYRNLRRIIVSGIRCPAPVALKDHILVMQQITLNISGVAMRLHDYKYVNNYIYSQVVCIMRVLYQRCKLIHGDLSEYNLLVSNNNLVYVIDVSQAVEHDHPEALEFLKRDCVNVNNFFKCHHQVDTVSNRLLFHFIVQDGSCGFINQLNNIGSPDNHEIDELSNIDSTVELLNFYNKIKKSSNQCHSNNDNTEELVEKIRQNRKYFNALVQNFSNWDKIEPECYNSDDMEGLMLPTQIGELSTAKVESIKVSFTDDKICSNEEEINDESSTDGNIREKKLTSPVCEKFTGIIPPHIDRKEWKKMVKELQRQQRMVKVPKYIKRKK